MKKKQILAQALVAMGYRKSKNDIFLKPIGKSILEGRFLNEDGKDVFNIALFFPGVKKLLCWNHKDINYLHPEETWTNVYENITAPELFDLYCQMIGSLEDSIGIEHAVNRYCNDAPLAFTTPYDVYHYMDVQ